MFDACLMVHGTWLKARGSLPRGGEPEAKAKARDPVCVLRVNEKYHLQSHKHFEPLRLQRLIENQKLNQPLCHVRYLWSHPSPH